MNTIFDTDRLEIISNTQDTYAEDLKTHILEGLTAPQKFIPSRYFYDAHGSYLFEKICHLPEYYLTRSELAILEDSAPVIMEDFQKGDLIELGSGANWKIKTLLEAAYQAPQANIRYVPVDVSEDALLKASTELLNIFPDLKVYGIVADFTKHADIIPTERNKLFIFFGSTIGNLSEEEGALFLKKIVQLMTPNDRLLLGLDMIKPKETLERAYNDSQGITSAFNKNSLSVVNRELGANFILNNFDHVAFLNREREQIEMHLRANQKVSVEINSLGLHIEIEKGETIRTEISRKFSKESAEKMATNAGFTITQWFTDPKGFFSLVEFMPDMPET
ncbi:MAG: L-histidine N(alpha)-methyltransferase [Candidatus Brocadiaceae bacterium]|nr:L-histidine N(alpha)-methyltransferase [Candidatus Brocadiaceae bacterium]